MPAADYGIRGWRPTLQSENKIFTETNVKSFLGSIHFIAIEWKIRKIQHNNIHHNLLDLSEPFFLSFTFFGKGKI
jgi:hypothetical protein